MKFNMIKMAVIMGLLGIASQVDAAEKTCNLWQVCSNHKDLTPGEYPDSKCNDGSDVYQPSFVDGNFAP